MRADDQQGDLGELGFYVPQQFQPAAVFEENIGDSPGSGSSFSITASALPAFSPRRKPPGPALSHQLAHAEPDDGMVIDKQDAHRFSRPPSRFGR